MKKVIIFFLIFISNALFADLIKIALKENQINLNPIYNPNNDIVKLLYLGLFHKSNKGLTPVIVKSYKVSNDFLTYQFNLHKGLYFIKNSINYGELSAEDVKATYDTIKNNLYNSSYEKLYNNISAINVIDKYTVEFTLKHKDNDFLNSLTLGIMSKNALIKYGLSWFNNDAIGLGSYYLKQINNEQIVLIKNQNSILKAKNDGVIFKLYQNDVQIKNALNNNLVDAGFIGYKNIKNLDENINVKEMKSNHSIALSLNNKIIYNRKLRYAISQIICNQSIIKQFPYLVKSEHTSNTCNKEAARKILNELGYYKDKRSIDLNINKEISVNYYKKLDIPLKLEIFINKKNKEYLAIAENIAMQLKDFGIITNILQSNDDEYEASKIIDIEYEDSYNFIKIFNTNKTQTQNIISTFVDNYYKKFKEQIKLNQPYIFLADFNYFLAYSNKITGVEKQIVGFNASNFYSQILNWQKYE